MWQQPIAIDPDVHHGEPCIKGRRIPVMIIIGSLADGMTLGEIRSYYPQLTTENIRAALAYAEAFVSDAALSINAISM